MRGMRSGTEAKLMPKLNTIKYCKGFAKWAILAVGNFKHIQSLSTMIPLQCVCQIRGTMVERESCYFGPSII